MSGDEILVTLVSGIAGLSALIRWYYHLGKLSPRCRSGGAVTLLALTPPACLFLLFVILKTLASWDVRDSPTYLAMYLIFGAGWLGLAMHWQPLLGVLPRDDALERGNSAAAFMTGGALLGFSACFAGGNIGDGPGWWVVLFSAGLASVTLYVLWLLLNRATGIVDRITVDRDPGSGFRAGVFLAAAGVVLGRAVAGNWVSTVGTVQDFIATGWPVFVLWGAAVLFEWFFKPVYKPEHRSVATEAIVPAFTFGLIAMFSVLAAGKLP